MFAEREGIVRAQHHPLRAHGLDEKLERAFIENRGINIESFQILTRRQFTNAVRHRMMFPGIFEPPQQKCKTSAAMREADTQIRGQLVERSAQDHRDDAELRFGRHADGPRHHVVRHALRRQHIPRMHEHRCALIGTVVEKCHDAGIVKILLANVIADLHAEMAGPHASAKFLTCRVRILQRYLAERLQSSFAMRAQLQRAHR